MEGAARAILSNGAQLLGEEYRLLRGVGPGVVGLRDDLETMSALLVMQSEAGDGALDHFSRVWMNQLRELAYDSEDCIDLYKLRIKCRTSDGVRPRLKHLLGTLLARRRLAGEIAALRARAVAIGERHARFGVNRDALRRRPLSSSAPPALAASVSTDALHDPQHQDPVGIEDQAKTLVEQLKKGDSSPMVLSIVGFGGLGKTTLAKEVCRRLEAEFPYQAMVSVSQAFEAGRDLDELCKRVLNQIEMVKAENARGTKNNETPLAQDKKDDPLKEFLKDKRYLIVIDDVWTVRAWDAIQSKVLLRENKCHSRIIVTTRIETVAKACSPATPQASSLKPEDATLDGQHYIHQMQRLKPEDSKKLFLARTFGKRECPKELVGTTKKILRRCAGLPLAIVSIANVLAGYTSAGSKYKWESIYNSMGSQMETHPTLEGMKQIITLSYNHLPHELKACMMYLSIFPEDYEIDKHRLLRRWIAEGLVLEKRGMTLMEVAESYLDELVSRSMIEVRVDFEYYWSVELCRVHDMLLEVMVSKSLESNFVSLLGGQYAGLSYGRIRRLSIQGADDRRPQDTEQRRSKKMLGHGIEGMDVEHARSLSMFQHGGQKLLDHLDKFTLLRVLDLEGCKGITSGHMNCICRLYLLRFLNLRGTDIKEVPSKIKNLEHLQTLDVRETSVKDLPGTVKELYKLERLKIGYRIGPGSRWQLPRGVSKMKALRELAFAGLGDDVEVAKEVGKLEQLEELSIYADTDNIKDNKVLPALTESLSNLQSLRRLIIGELYSFEKGALNFLHEMRKGPQLLQYLMIAGGMDKGLPPWMESLTYLVQFNMSWGQLDQGDQLFSVLCKLPNLKIICLYNHSYIGHDLVARSKHKFPELTNLRVDCNNANTKVLRFEEGSMPKLETLLFQFVNHEKRIEGIEHLTSLKEVHLWGTKENPAIEHALEQLRAENQRRREKSMKEFQITVKY